MEKREMICISCPLGCDMEVELQDGQVINVTGNTCPRGKIYAQKECTNPTRIVTSSVFVKNGEINVVSVKTEEDIPKGLIFECLKELKKVEIEAPVKVGDIVVENILDTGVNIVATKDILAC